MKEYFTSLILFFVTLCLTATVYSGEKARQFPPPPQLAVWGVPDFTMDDTEDITPSNEFNLKHARVIVKSKGVNNWGYHAMAELFGADGKTSLMQAWVSYQVNKYLNLRFGQFKYPFGFEAYPALILWKFVNPSYVTGSIVKSLGRTGSIFRDIGVQASGAYPFSETVTGLYSVMIMNGSGGIYHGSLSDSAKRLKSLLQTDFWHNPVTN
jgi:hypothetical protein